MTVLEWLAVTASRLASTMVGKVAMYLWRRFGPSRRKALVEAGSSGQAITEVREPPVSILTLSPRQILDEISAAPPFQRGDKAGCYAGLEVRWTLQFSAIEPDKWDTALHRLVFLEASRNVTLVLTRVKLANYPRLKTLSEGEMVVVCGAIEKISRLSIELTNVRLQFLS